MPAWGGTSLLVLVPGFVSLSAFLKHSVEQILGSRFGKEKTRSRKAKISVVLPALTVY